MIMRSIFRLTKLAFLKATATLKENTIKLLKFDNENNRSIDSMISYFK